MMKSTNLYPSCRRRYAGFTYLGLLILIAIIGIATAATLHVGSLLARSAAEEELLAIGAEYRRALISYANAMPKGLNSNPSSLQDLLKDPRYPGTRRHLRKLYNDPITGNDQWGVVPAIGSPGIMGVYSLSNLKPIKIGNFEVPFQTFEGSSSYTDWKFIVAPAPSLPTASTVDAHPSP
jgi:type II secretory pathway pseudopilin PulG